MHHGVQRIQQMINEPGTEAVFTIERTAEAQDRDSLAASISQEALQHLNDSIHGWIGTRILRFGNETGLMPQNVYVKIDVQLSA